MDLPARLRKEIADGQKNRHLLNEIDPQLSAVAEKYHANIESRGSISPDRRLLYCLAPGVEVTIHVAPKSINSDGTHRPPGLFVVLASGPIIDKRTGRHVCSGTLEFELPRDSEDLAELIDLAVRQLMREVGHSS